MTRLLSAPILLCAALIAGCGDSASNAPAPPASAGPAKSAPAPVGGLRVTPTDLRLGDATVTDANGLRQLPHTLVPGTSKPQQGVGAGASCDGVNQVPTRSAVSEAIDSTLCLLNGERADAGLRPLSQNNALARAAIAHTEEMVAKQYFDHAGRDGTDPVDRIRSTGYIPSSGTWTVGENLAWGTGTLSTPRSIVAAWMKSQGHRENILRPVFREIGFGVLSGNPRSESGSGVTITTTFGVVSGSAARISRRHRRARAARRARIASRG